MARVPSTFSIPRRSALFAGLLGLAVSLSGCGSFGGKPAPAEISVMTSGGFTAAYNDLRPHFEKRTGHTVKTAYGASMGNASDSIPSRLGRGEPADVVILARSALDALAKDGKVVQGSQVDLVRSAIGFAVKKGAPRPDISTVDALKRTLIAAPSIAYSASASGTYYETEMLKNLGVKPSKALPQPLVDRSTLDEELVVVSNLAGLPEATVPQHLVMRNGAKVDGIAAQSTGEPSL